MFGSWKIGKRCTVWPRSLLASVDPSTRILQRQVSLLYIRRGGIDNGSNLAFPTSRNDPIPILSAAFNSFTAEKGDSWISQDYNNRGRNNTTPASANSVVMLSTL